MVIAVVERARTLLEQVTSTEGRLVVSVLVLLVGVTVAAVATPYFVRRVRNAIRGQVVAKGADDWMFTVEEYVDVGVGIVHVVRMLQLAIAILTGVTLLVVWGLTDLAREVLTLLSGSLPALVDIGATVALVIAAYVAIGFLEAFIDSLGVDGDTLDEHQAEILFRVSQVAIIVLVFVMALGIWGVDLGGLLIGAGFLGIVVGMAARQTLGSVIAGFVLMFSRPFEVGDWIQVGDDEGIVTDISIVNTRMENFDGEYVVIPNDVVSNSVVINRTRKGRLRIRLEVGVDYAVPPTEAEDVAKAAMADVEEVMAVPRPQVVPQAFGDSAVILELRFWIDNPSARRKWRAKAAVVRAVYAAFEEAGIKIPYPQRELTGRQEAGGFHVIEERQTTGRDPGAEASTDPGE